MTTKVEATKQAELTKEEVRNLPEGFFSSLYVQMEKYTQTELVLPKGYNLAVAIQSATNGLRKVKDWHTADKESIKNAVRNMITMGHLMENKHGYFIKRGNEMSYEPSYMGYQLTMKRDYGAKDSVAILVYDKDEVTTEVIDGVEYIIGHKRGYGPFAKEVGDIKHVVGAYNIITFHDDRKPIHELMTMEQINKSWNQSSSTQRTVHKNFPDQMIFRTVMNRASKKVINSGIATNANVGLIQDAYYDVDKYNFDNEDAYETEANTVEVKPQIETNTKEADRFDSFVTPDVEPIVAEQKEEQTSIDDPYQ